MKSQESSQPTREKKSARSRLSPSCGLILDDIDRKVCDECLPDYDRERTEKLSSAGKAALAAMRSSGADPAQSPEARAKRAAKSRATSLAMRAWEREHGLVTDPDVYEREVLPKIRELTVPALLS